MCCNFLERIFRKRSEAEYKAVTTNTVLWNFFLYRKANLISMSHLTKEAICRLEICFLKIKYFMTKYRSSFLIEDTKQFEPYCQRSQMCIKEEKFKQWQTHKQNYFKCIQTGIYFLWYKQVIQINIRNNRTTENMKRM